MYMYIHMSVCASERAHVSLSWHKFRNTSVHSQGHKKRMSVPVDIHH